MKKHIIIISILATSLSAKIFSQVGIHTPTPKATLDIVKGTIVGYPDGILVPRFDVNDLAPKDAAYGSDQNGTMVYITSTNTGQTPKTGEIQNSGFYFYDAPSSKWKAVGGYAGSQPLAIWVRNQNGQRVELAVLSDGGSRPAGIDFVAGDNGNVGIGTSAPDKNAMLDVTANNKGVLLPRLTTTQRDAIPATLANGLLIYNISQNCFNYYDNAVSQWLSLCGTGAPAKFDLLDCSVAPSGPSGTYTQGTALNSSNTYKVKINVTQAGTYEIIAKTTNGYSFYKSGTFTQTGSYDIVLEGQGNPVAGPQSDVVSLMFNGISVASTCTPVNVAGNTTMITMNCAGAQKFGTYNKGITVNSSNYVDIPVTAVTTPGPVNITTNTANGLTFSSGSITITASTTSIRLFAQGTPTNTDNGTLNTYTFTIPTNNGSCSFGVTVNSSIGTFANPAASCQKIFDEFNSSGTLVANDGEYWIGSSTANRYKTRCDMVDAAEASSLDKEVGGYTLLMSYSEGTATTNGDWSTNGRFSWGSSDLDGRNVVTAQTGTMNYNNFRINTSEKSRWNGKATRQTFTATPTNSNVALDTYLKYPVSDIISGNESYYRSAGAGTVSGKYLGGITTMTKNATGDRATLTIDGVMIEDSNYFYNNGYNTHWDQTVYRYAPTLNGGNGAVIANFPLTVVGEYVSSLPFGYCINTISFTPSPPEGGGYPSKAFTNSCVPNNNNLGRHPSVNGTEGYVMQWWGK